MEGKNSYKEPLSEACERFFNLQAAHHGFHFSTFVLVLACNEYLWNCWIEHLKIRKIAEFVSRIF